MSSTDLEKIKDEMLQLKRQVKGINPQLTKQIIPSCRDYDQWIIKLFNKTKTASDLHDEFREEFHTAMLRWKQAYADTIRRNLESIDTLLEYHDEQAENWIASWQGWGNLKINFSCR